MQSHNSTCAVLSAGVALERRTTGGRGHLSGNELVSSSTGDDAVWRSLVETPTGRALLAADRKTPIAFVQIDGKTYSTNSAARRGDTLVVGFASVDTELEYDLQRADDWLTFRLARIRGVRPQGITFLRIGVDLTEHVGTRLNGAWDEETAVVLRGANRQALCRPGRRGESIELTAAAQDEPGPKLEGTAAALVVAPTERIRDVLARFAEVYDLPTNTTSDGVASKDTSQARGSYWFLRFGEGEVEQVIECCRKTGFRQGDDGFGIVVHQFWALRVQHVGPIPTGWRVFGERLPGFTRKAFWWACIALPRRCRRSILT